ncbi:MFS transporter [Paenibacillus sp. HB172176]|uniref:MFS transporter n=1 Tax=Paenibacillus sp. HB172176 TaxID=2493690 RepID=UPI00143B7516|nr:MFS transporter [Paenibacillus sp. HB172176]
MNKEKIWTRNFFVVCMSSFFMFLTFYISATAFPLYVKEGLHGDQRQMGLVITVYVIGSVMLRPFSGGWVDRFGQKKMAIIGMIVFLAASISYFGTKNGIFLFLFARLIHGMSYALSSTATSTVAASIIPASRQGEGMGYFSMFMSIGMVIGPALGLFLWKDKNVNVLLLSLCVITAISLAFTLIMKAPERSRISDQAAEKPLQTEKKRNRLHWSKIIEPTALPISLVGFILSFSYSSLSGFIASFTSEIHQSQVTSTFFVAFAVMIVAFRPLIGRVFDRYKEHYLYYPGIFLFSIGMLLLSQAHSGTMVLVDGIIMGIGYGALLPCLQTLAMKLAPEHRRGNATGTFFLLFDLGYGIGSYFMGFIAAYTDYRMMYVVAAFVPMLSAALYYLLHHRKQFKLAAARKQEAEAA